MDLQVVWVWQNSKQQVPTQARDVMSEASEELNAGRKNVEPFEVVGRSNPLYRSITP